MKYTIIPVTPFMQNCQVIWDENTLEAVVVDPGGEAEKIISAIESRGLKLTKILLELHVQAGGGIVADSVPALEWEETINKRRAMFRAVALAEQTPLS